MMNSVKELIKKILNYFGYKISKIQSIPDFYLYKYKDYDEYKKVQIFHNKRKIEKIFADKKTLNRVGNILLDKFPNKLITGICHGSRNGFEQNYLRDLSPDIEAIGTDISETVHSFENSLQLDFHDEKKDFIGKFDFVFSNSLDQSWNPKKALTTWLNQIKRNGILILEYTEAHGPKGASEKDPFGVRPINLPYILTMWFGSQISISHTKDKKDNYKNNDAWLFVVTKNIEKVEPLISSEEIFNK
jgi:hypothetical protein